MIPRSAPPTDAKKPQQLRTEPTFPADSARYAIPPTCDGYPNFDTYRELEPCIVER